MRSTRNSYVFRRIFDALAQRAGKQVTLPTLVTVTGLNAKQIQSSIAHARRVSEVHARQIEVVKLGHTWKLKEAGDVGGYLTPDDVVKEVEVGSTHIWKIVLKALIGNAGKITSKDLLAELASTPERPITPLQVSNAMLTILRQPEIAPNIEVRVAGLAWVYHDPSQKKAVAKSSKSDGEKRKSTSSPIRGSVLRYFANHPGETLFRDDIAEELGFSIQQVQNAMWSLLNENPATKKDFDVVQSSYAWRYVPNREVKPESNGHVTPTLEKAPAKAYTLEAASTTLPVSSTVPNIPQAAPTAAVATATATTTTGRLFEEIGQLTDGAVLVKEAESNVIYRATPLA